MNYRKILIILIVLTVSLRLLFGLLFFSDHKPDYWEYGAIAENIISVKGYSLFYLENNEIKIETTELSKPYPSAYMMPGYVYFIIPFFLINQSPHLLIFLIQAIIAGITAYLIFRLVLPMFDKKTALAAVAIYSFLPEFIYSSNTIGPTIIFHLLIVIFLILIHKNNITIFHTIGLGIISLLMIYFRPESALFLILIIIYFIFKKKYRSAFSILVICLIGLSPWIVRNQIVFNETIPLTTSTGLNFYRGHNPYYNGFWMDENIHKKITAINDPVNFEIRMNEIYTNEAYKTIKQNPAKDLVSMTQKIWQLWIYNPIDNRSRNMIYLLPWLSLLLLFIYGLIGTIKSEKLVFIYIFLISSTISAMLFFALPRYQTLMKVAMLPIAAHGIMMLVNRFSKRE